MSAESHRAAQSRYRTSDKGRAAQADYRERRRRAGVCRSCGGILSGGELECRDCLNGRSIARLDGVIADLEARRAEVDRLEAAGVRYPALVAAGELPDPTEAP